MPNWITGHTSVSVCHLWSDVGSIILHSHSNFARQRLKIQTHTHTVHTLFATHTLVKLTKHTREHTLDSCLCECASVFLCLQCAASCRLHMASANYFCIIYSGSLTHTHTRSHLPALLLQHFISHLPPPPPAARSGSLCLLASCAISNHIWAIKI